MHDASNATARQPALAALAYALIHGKLGLPALGVRGAGYATAMTEMLELTAAAFVLTAQRSLASMTPSKGGSLGESFLLQVSRYARLASFPKRFPAWASASSTNAFQAASRSSGRSPVLRPRVSSTSFFTSRSSEVMNSPLAVPRRS